MARATNFLFVILVMVNLVNAPSEGARLASSALLILVVALNLVLFAYDAIRRRQGKPSWFGSPKSQLPWPALMYLVVFGTFVVGSQLLITQTSQSELVEKLVGVLSIVLVIGLVPVFMLMLKQRSSRKEQE